MQCRQASSLSAKQGFLRWPPRFPDGSAGKESVCSTGDTGDAGSIPGWGRSPGGGQGNPLQCSCLENPMDRGAWRAAARGASVWDVTEHTRRCPLCLFTPQQVSTLSPTLYLKSTFLSLVHSVRRSELSSAQVPSIPCKECPTPACFPEGRHLCPPAVQLLAMSITDWPQVLERAWHTPGVQQNSVNSAEQMWDIWLFLQHDHPLSPWGQGTFLAHSRWETTSKQLNSDKVCFDIQKAELPPWSFKKWELPIPPPLPRPSTEFQIPQSDLDFCLLNKTLHLPCSHLPLAKSPENSPGKKKVFKKRTFEVGEKKHPQAGAVQLVLPRKHVNPETAFLSRPGGFQPNQCFSAAVSGGLLENTDARPPLALPWFSHHRAPSACPTCLPGRKLCRPQSSRAATRATTCPEVRAPRTPRRNYTSQRPPRPSQEGRLRTKILSSKFGAFSCQPWPIM